MKRLTFIYVFFFLSIHFSFAQENSIALDWVSSYKKAQKISKKQGKPILIYFTGSDWCGPCKILDKKLFHTQKFAEYANKNLVLYKADVPRNKDLVDAKTKKVNKMLSKKYKQRSFPTLVMVNYRGKELGVKHGMYMTEYYFPFFENIVNNYH